MGKAGGFAGKEACGCNEVRGVLTAHVFLLLVYIGTGDFRTLDSDDMYFWDINECNYFASRVTKRYGNYEYSDFIDAKDRVTAYCVPRYVNPDDVKVY